MEPRIKNRTYGHWRIPRAVGMSNLSGAATALIFAGLIAAIIAQMIKGWVAALVTVIITVIVVVLISIKDRDHLSLAQRLGHWVTWQMMRRKGAHLYRSGPLGRVPWGTAALPGVLAAARLFEHEDSYGRPFGMIYYPQAGYYSVVFAAQPDGESLVDQDQVDLWVARWGEWLASLGQDMSVLGATVCVETAPDSGSRLRQEVEANLVDDAPEVAKAMLAEVTRYYPSGSASIRAWITLTVSSQIRPGARRRNPDEVGRDMASKLPSITRALEGTGAGPCRPCGAQEICEIVRSAFDPDVLQLMDEARVADEIPDLSWTNVGPMAAEASWDSYRHDSGISVTWAMSNAPRGLVFSSVLSPLLSPHKDILRKRITLLYRPIEAGRAAALVEADVRAAQVRATSTHNPGARVLVEKAAAEATAREEAQGAGLENFGMLVTATCSDASELSDVRATVDSLGSAARITLRPVYGSQDFAFASALPLGIIPQQHAAIPEMVRGAL